MCACTPYLFLTKLPPCTLLFRSARLFNFLDFCKQFCQIFRPNLKTFGITRFNFWNVQRVNKVFLIMNKTASFHPALFLVFEQNSSLHTYSGLHAYLIFVKVPPCTLIRVTRVLYLGMLKEELKSLGHYLKV